MQTSDHIRRAGLVGVTAGALYGLLGVILLFEPRSGAWFYLVYSVFTGAVILTFVTLRGLHSSHRGRDRRLGLAGFFVSSIGLGFLAVTAGVRVATGKELLDPVFALGFLLAGVGYLLFWGCSPQSRSAATLERILALGRGRRGSCVAGQTRRGDR